MRETARKPRHHVLEREPARTARAAHGSIGRPGAARRGPLDVRGVVGEAQMTGRAVAWGRGVMKTTMLVLAALIAIALLPSSALAATCADYTTQAEAQRAGDTRDADGAQALRRE